MVITFNYTSRVRHNRYAWGCAIRRNGLYMVAKQLYLFLLHNYNFVANVE